MANYVKILLRCSILLSLISISMSYAQSTSKTVDYYGNEIFIEDISGSFGFSTIDNQVQTMVTEILNLQGISRELDVRAATGVHFAIATLNSSKDPVIMYNPEQMTDALEGEERNWIALAILAHEVGHHINGHMVDIVDGQGNTLGQARRHSFERQADETSGFVLYRMGASVEEAQQAVVDFVADDASSTHPGKQSRLSAIANGWFRAEAQFPTNTQEDVTVADTSEVEEGGSFEISRNENEGILNIQTEPNGASVTIDGRELGQTPLSESIAAGEYLLEINLDGYETVKGNVEVEAARQNNLSIPLEATESNPFEVNSEGFLNIETEPSGATVTIDGRELGQTPLSESIAAGEYTLEISLDGYETVNGRANVEADKQNNFSVPLEATESNLLTTTTTTSISPADIEPVLNNKDWEIVRKTDALGYSMVLVPPGSFMMGSGEQAGSFRGHQPAHQQTIESAFWIDETEVTNAAYEACIAAGYCKRLRFPSQNSTEPDQPIIGITLDESFLFCLWREGAVPTELEWEYAARGPDSLDFPWGSIEIPAFANLNSENKLSSARPVSVGSYPDGKSWVGALDMIGNAAEMTRSLATEKYPYIRDDGRELTKPDRSISFGKPATRGGSFVSLNGSLTKRGAFNSGYTGLRCVSHDF